VFRNLPSRLFALCLVAGALTAGCSPQQQTPQPEGVKVSYFGTTPSAMGIVAQNKPGAAKTRRDALLYLQRIAGKYKLTEVRLESSERAPQFERNADYAQSEDANIWLVLRAKRPKKSGELVQVCLPWGRTSEVSPEALELSKLQPYFAELATRMCDVHLGENNYPMHQRQTHALLKSVSYNPKTAALRAELPRGVVFDLECRNAGGIPFINPYEVQVAASHSIFGSSVDDLFLEECLNNALAIAAPEARAKAIAQKREWHPENAGKY
jgi:hypothetical protein